MKTKNLIEENYITLTKTEKKIANFLLADQNYLIINMTLQELSKELGLGEASIIRFCRKMGFRGFQDLKVSLAIENAKDEETGVQEEVDSVQTMETMVQVIKSRFSSMEQGAAALRQRLRRRACCAWGNAARR